ncbi:HD domain-containing phosphohydrolase [Clostridium thermobutyricum]|uniref:HD domain-containing phosphohydrolase n=1 Tax=Clostridium thermobutyricum TaxID=29372 RepID=UPI0018A95D76|nr:HD domain-containing phosphohydrolase [Clostridium thermobutyricum]
MQNIFKMLLENIDFPVWIKDLNLKFIFANEKYADFINKNKEEIVGLKNEDLFDKDSCSRINEHCYDVIKTGKFIIRGRDYKGSYRQCLITPINDYNGRLIAIAGIIGIFNEIGQIKEKECEIEHQRTLTKNIIDILPGIIFYKDIDGKYIYANKECIEFYKKRGIEDIIGKTDLEIIENKEQAINFIEIDKNVIKSKQHFYDEEAFIQEDGSKSYKEIVKIPFLDSYGNPLGVIGRALDVTKDRIYREKLEYLSYTDVLTGAKNRASFEAYEKKLSNENKFPIGIIMGDANGLKLVNDTFGHKEGDELLIQITRVLKEASELEVFRIGGDEFAILLPNTDLKSCEKVIKKISKRCDEYENKLFNISISLGSAVKNKKEEDIYEVLKIAEDKVYRKKLLQNKSIKSSILNSLKIALKVSYEETDNHTERVAINAVKIGEKLGLDLSQIDELKIAAELHDIGKIGIPEDILMKKGKLTEKEFEIIKTHPEKSYRIIKASSELKGVAEATLYHHERWDGKGYPLGLKGEEIPLLSLIISVCDAYDIMTRGRVYKSAISKDEALKELVKCAGTQFDPKVVDEFVKIREKINIK